MATLVEATPMSDANGNIIRDGVRRNRSGSMAIRPKIRRKDSAGSNNSSARSMIGSFRLNMDDANLCTTCDTKTQCNDIDSLVIVEGLIEENSESNDVHSIASAATAETLNEDATTDPIPPAKNLSRRQ